MTHHQTPEDRLLADGLHRLARDAALPPTAPADDVRRGRGRLRRQRLLVGVGAATTVGVVALGSALLGGGDQDTSTPPVAGGSEVADPTPVEPPEPQDGERVLPTVRGDEVAAGAAADPLGEPTDHTATLRRYHRVLAERLDPRGEHLEPWSADTANQQGSGAGDLMTSLGSKFGWRNPGEEGLGMLQVNVSAGWSPDSTQMFCGSELACEDVTGPNGERAVVGSTSSAGRVVVAVEHADGQVVVLTSDALFGNNSTVPVSGTGLEVDELLAAAADDRLSLPGDPVVPVPLDAAAFERAGRRALVGEGETWSRTSSPGTYVDGPWSNGAGDGGSLAWDVNPTYGDVAGWQCWAEQFQRCVERTVEGRRVFVGYVKPRWGGGLQVIHTGPSYEVRVLVDDRDFPIDRAVRFVLDDRWQPANR
ncbi:hypothetical protein [Nocardioides sp. SYSU D00038]|uniref:hypothetical protein n=1 Tax=Nocardioides sp. SYSU D00038 TaxID=2812554 RepID=UPI0019686711|nr:hypothetical protein [Nocardioides sp. SYSU D00038]